MPGELAVSATGHDMTNVSAFYEYMQASRAMLQPACRVLTGWNPPKFGELGRGPVAPSLSVLSQSDGEIAEKMIQILCNIDGRYPDKWQVGGDLWSIMIKASGAALLMHYETQNEECMGRSIQIDQAVVNRRL